MLPLAGDVDGCNRRGCERLPSYSMVSLKNLVQMVANVFDSFTAALFIRSHQEDFLDLVAWESLSPHIVPGCRIEVGHGLIGWVVREEKRLHVTHFDRDTRTLGIYSKDVKIKAFLAAPLPHGEGALMVDSKNRYAFPEKKQRILEDCATMAFDLWSSWRNRCELEFYRRWSNWYLVIPGETGSLLASLGELLGLKCGLVAFQKGDESSFVVEADIGLSGKASLNGQSFSVDKGLVGWILRHKKHLILSHFGIDRHRSYFLWSDEPFNGGPVVIGLYQPIEGGAFVWILTGDIDMSGWPKDFAKLLVYSLGRVFSV